MTNEQAREARVRRAVDRAGYMLRKDRARSLSLDRQGGYMIVDPDINGIVAGEKFDLNLDDVEEWLRA